MLRINIKFLLLTIAACLFAYLQGGNLPYAVLYGFIVPLLIGLVCILNHKQKIFLDMQFDQKIYSAGDKDVLSTVVYNKSFIPMPYIWLTNKGVLRLNSNYNGEILNLKHKESKVIKHEITFRERGIYEFGDVSTKLKDLFCIFEAKKNFQRSCDIKVYPKVFNIEKSVLSGSDIFKNAVNNKSSIEDAYSTRDMRKYRDGDNLKRINWKVSAKFNELYVRDFETVSGKEFNIFLDMNKTNYELDSLGVLEERLVDFCVSLINHTMLKEVKANVFINAERPQVFEIEDKADFEKLMEYFLTQFSDSNLDFTRYLSGSINKVSSLGGIGIITGSIGRALTEVLMHLRDSGYNIVVFHLGGYQEELNNIGLLNKVGIECINISDFLNNGVRSEIG